MMKLLLHRSLPEWAPRLLGIKVAVTVAPGTAVLLQEERRLDQR